MATYHFRHWEDPTIITPKRVVDLKSDKEITAYYEEVVEVRKGQPSQSGTVNVVVHPTEAEPTVLTLASDKPEYNSGETINLIGDLKFESDGVPLESRTVEIYKNGVLLGSSTTIADGSFLFIETAPDVTESTPYDYQAKFAGDP